jgi:spore coat polysaccharide biosynthesis protein SpsF (cytidylyltransferase family)
MKTAIIQARMTSTRLPGKVLEDLGGEPLLARVVERALRATRLDQVGVATTDRATDDPVADFCRQSGILCFRGDEDDVLDRYRQAAAAFGGDVIVRLTADCPLLDPAVIDRVIEGFESADCDYASNTVKPTFPDGLDTEVFTRKALETAWRDAALTSEREHVTPFIWKRPEQFRIRSVEQAVDLSALRWTVDDAADLQFVRAVFAGIEPGQTAMEDVLALLRRHPDIGSINAGALRNERYLKSLRTDAEAGKGW